MDSTLIKLGAVLLTVLIRDASVAEGDSVFIDVVQPTPIVRAPPIYPRRQQQRGAAGAVELSFIVDAQGATKEVIAVRSTHGDFERSAIAAVEKYIYEPAKFKGTLPYNS